MTITVQRNGACARLVFEGPLTIQQAAQDKAALLEALAGDGDLEFDLAQVDDMDTAGLQLLLLGRREALAAGKSARLAAHSAAYRDVADGYGLDAQGDAVKPAPRGGGAWHISVRFHPQVLVQGMDPLSLIRYLSTLGEVEGVVPIADAMPDARAMDPLLCYIGVEIRLRSDAAQQLIAGAFDFLRPDSQVRILPPDAPESGYLRLIDELPEDPARLREIFENLGALQAISANNPATAAAAQDAGTTPVRSAKLDELINLLGELVIVSARIKLGAQRAGIGELQEAATGMSRLVEEMRGTALAMRTVPIGDIVERLTHALHEAHDATGRAVELAVRGADAEIDKSMADKLVEPLTCLLRRELARDAKPAQPVSANAPVKTRLTLNAYHEAGSIVIEVSGDEAATQAGGHNDAAGDLDAVREGIESLGGTVAIDGAVAAVRLPLTLAIIDGFLVGVGESAYVIPLEMTVECLELSGRERDELRDTGYVNLRGELLPLLRLRDVFDASGEPARRENVVVVQCAGARAGFVVDELLGEFQAVVKPLGRLFERLSGITGSTILGSGEVALILDVQALAQRVVGREASADLRNTREACSTGPPATPPTSRMRTMNTTQPPKA